MENRAHTTEKQAESSEDAGPPTQSTELRRETIRFVKVIATILLAVLFVRTFVAESWPVQGPSMAPTLQEDDRIVVFKLPTMLSRLPLFRDTLETGDLVVFKTDEPDAQRLVKRVIAAGPPARSPGVVRADTVDELRGTQVLFDKGTVYVNNQRMEEAYLLAQERASTDVNRVTLGPGEFYVLGDHRRVSKDSRLLGPIRRDQVVGEAVLRIWPLSRFGWL